MEGNSKGNFLLQALLALALIVAFIPFFTNKIISRESDLQTSAVATQANTAATAAKIYLRENPPDNGYVLSGNNFTDTLEPYGLPLGFVPRTQFNQTISLVVNVADDNSVFSYIELAGGDMTGLRRAELVRRLGFYASQNDDNVYILIPTDETYSDLVDRRGKRPDDVGFLTDLDMGGFGVENVAAVLGQNGEFETATIATLALFGTNDNRDMRNKIDNLIASHAVFQSADDTPALSLTRGALSAVNINAKTIAKYGAAGTLDVADAAVFEFAMTAGRTDFTGPGAWEVRGNVVTNNTVFYTNRLEILSSINAARGQDVFIDAETLEYNTQSGIEVGTIRASEITLRDQTSYSLLHGGTGAVLVDIRPNGTSVLPDVLTDGVNNDAFLIISDPNDDGGNNVTCKSVIEKLGGAYDKNSLSQNIICRYVFWHRLERRIDIKQCMLNGGSDCR